MAVFLAAVNLSSMLLSDCFPKFVESGGEWVLRFVCECAAAVVGIITVSVFRLRKIWHEYGRGADEGIIASLCLVAVSLINLIYQASFLMDDSGGAAQFEAAWKVCAFVAAVFLTGFTEEIFFRGIISNLFYEKHAKDSAGVWTAVIGSGFLFGLMQIGSGIVAFELSASNEMYADTRLLMGSMAQAAVNCVLGMALTAVYYRCRNIWVVALVHGFMNFCSLFSNGILSNNSYADTISSYSPINFLSILPYAILTVFLLRPKKMKGIIGYRQSRIPDFQDEQPDMLVQNQDSPNQRSSKTSLRIAVTCASVMIISMFVLSMSFLSDTPRTDLSSDVNNADADTDIDTDVDTDAHRSTKKKSDRHSLIASGTWYSVENTIVKCLGGFVAQNDGDYTFELASQADDSRVLVTIGVRDSKSNLLTSVDMRGNSEELITLTLEEGERYEITAIHNFMDVPDGTVNYTVHAVVKSKKDS